MKKYVLLAICLCIAVCSVPNVNAQSSTTSSDPSKFYINFGAISDDDFTSFYWQTGVMLDLPLGNNLFITPEAMFLGYKFNFDELYLYPGATINLKFGEKGNSFFVGSGLLLYILLAPSGHDLDLSDLILKIHGGFIGDNLKLTAYMYTFTQGLFDSVLFGANVGFAL